MFPISGGGTETILTGIICSTANLSGTNVSFAYSFPHNIQSVKLKRIICLGIPIIEINEFCIVDAATSAAYCVVYYQTADSTLISNLSNYTSLAELEITYS